MKVLKADPYARRHTAAPTRRLEAAGGVSLFAFMFLSLSLIVLSRLNHGAVQDLRARLVEGMLPVLETVSVPAIRVRQMRERLETYVNVLGELDQLEHQKQQVERWQARALELEREIDKYRQLVNARDLRTFSFVTGRVVADGRGVFARSVILNVGTRAGVASGRPVVDAGGLVGRTLNAGERATRVLLLTDPNSRIPVRFGAEGLEGVLVGDTTPTPEIAFAPQSTTAKVNDEVRTSGRGGLFPPGLAIGRITTISPRVRVSLYTDPDQIDFVSVLLFERPEVDAFDGAADPALVAARATAAGGEPKRGDMALPVRPPRAVARDAGRQQAVRRERRTQRGRGQ